MNYCQRSLHLLTLAVVQMYSMQEQSTLRDISWSVLGGSRHETKLTKQKCAMLFFSFHGVQRDFIFKDNILGSWNHLRWI